MGQDISATVRFASEKRCATFSIDGSTKRAIIDSGYDTTEFFLKLFINSISSKYPEEVFMVSTESTRDFENSYKDWYTVQNGRYTQVKSFVDYNQEESDDNQQGDEENPDWFVEHENGAYRHAIHYMTDYATNSIYFYGEFSETDNNMFLEIAEAIASETSCDYVQYDINDEYCLQRDNVVAISSLTEKEQEKYFGRKPEFTNETATLFTPLHPELLAVYGDERHARIGYDKGEFALYETPEGMKFYTCWRKWSKVNKIWDKSKNEKFSLFLLLGLYPVKGESVDVNPLYRIAQQDFIVGAVQYRDEHFNRTFGALYGERYGEYEYKIVKKEDDTLHKVTFKMSNFFPL